MIKYNRNAISIIFLGEKTMDKKLIDRINVLSKKSKAEGLTESEKSEQETLRKQYLEQFRKNFRKQLDNIDVTYVD